MKNLKRVLSLALAGTMLSGMMAMGASAANSDFTDAAEITHKEAVDTMASLGVLKGKDTGAFDPTSTVTRAEMAKIICVMLNGGNDPTLGTTSGAMFTDIQNHWAKNYIEYCANMKIIAGQGDGTFAPDAPVTGNAAAKMLLVAMGYDSTIFEFTGPDWDLNVARRANDAKLFDEIKTIDANAGLSRDNTAQMAYNALSAKVMVTTYDKVVSTGEVSWNYRLEDETFLEKYFGVVKVVGIVTNNEFTDGESMEGKTILDVTNHGATEEQNVLGDGRYSFGTGKDEVGKAITVYMKPYVNANTNTNRATIIGSPVVNASNTVYATAKTLVNDEAESNDVQKVLKDEGLRFENGNNVKTFTNFVVTTAADGSAKTNLDNYVNTKGTEAQYIDNDGDGVIDVVTYLVKSFGKVTLLSKAGNGSLTISKLGSQGVNETAVNGLGVSALSTTKAVDKVANWNTDELGIEKNDYATYYYVKGAGLYYVDKVEGKTVTVNAKSSRDTIRTSDGNYTLSGLASGSDVSAESGTQANLHSAVEIGKDAVLYLDAAGYVIYVTDVDTTTSYLMLTDVATSTGDWQDTVSAKVVFEDGTKGEIKVVKLDGKTVVKTVSDASTEETAGNVKNALDSKKISDTSNGKIFSYERNSKGEYELTTIGGTVNYNGAVSNVTPTLTTGAVADTATKFVMNTTGSNYTFYTGIANVSNRTGAEVFVVTNNSGVAKVVFTQGGTGVASANDYMYFLTKWPVITKDSNGDNVYTYDVIRNGEATTIEGDSATLVGSAGVYKVTFNGNIATGATASDTPIVAAALATKASNGVIANSTGSYYYDDKTVVILITGSDPEEDVSLTSIDAIITEGGAQDTIAMIKGTNSGELATAKYVFVIRDGSGLKNMKTIAPEVPAGGVDLAHATTIPTPATTLTGGSVVDDSNVEMFDVSNEIDKLPGATSVAIIKVKVTGKTQGASITCTKYTGADCASGQQIAQAGTVDETDGADGWVYMVIGNNTGSVKLNDGTTDFYFVCTPW